MRCASIRLGGEVRVGSGSGDNIAQAMRPDMFVEGEVLEWLRERAAAGRPLAERDRLMVSVVRSETAFQGFLHFAGAVERGQRDACLLVFNVPDYYAESAATAKAALGFLDLQMQALAAAGGVATDSHQIGRLATRCPVTGTRTVFDDFCCAPLCPQCGNAADPEYDPARAAPYTALFAHSPGLVFARNVRETAHLLFRTEVYALGDAGKIERVFSRALETAPPERAVLVARWRAHFSGN